MKFYVFLFKSDFKKDSSHVLVMYLWENASGKTIITNACDKIAFLKILHIFINVYYRFSIYMYVYIKICMYVCIYIIHINTHAFKDIFVLKHILEISV